jgi:hypothetical protein
VFSIAPLALAFAMTRRLAVLLLLRASGPLLFVRRSSVFPLYFFFGV